MAFHGKDTDCKGIVIEMVIPIVSIVLPFVLCSTLFHFPLSEWRIKWFPLCVDKTQKMSRLEAWLVPMLSNLKEDPLLSLYAPEET